MGEAARHCPALTELRDFEWAQPVLAGGASKLDLSKKKLGHTEAAVLGALLPRTAQSLRDLNVRYVASPAPSHWTRGKRHEET